MARDPERIPEILASLQDAWEQNTDARFFQLLYNIVQTNDGLSDLYNVEDWQFAALVQEHIRHNQK